MKHVFGNSEYLLSTSTYQFDDYSKYAMTIIKGENRVKRRKKIFPKDCQKAFLLGKRLCK
ncbi:MAG: hypothetical protein FWD47_05320 [Treponema sp.]|nr:hypothetical protein [Treponema sp.]